MSLLCVPWWQVIFSMTLSYHIVGMVFKVTIKSLEIILEWQIKAVIYRTSRNFGIELNLAVGIFCGDRQIYFINYKFIGVLLYIVTLELPNLTKWFLIDFAKYFSAHIFCYTVGTLKLYFPVEARHFWNLAPSRISHHTVYWLCQ